MKKGVRVFIQKQIHIHIHIYPPLNYTNTVNAAKASNYTAFVG